MASKVEWNTAAAAHLLRRAAFGGTPEEAAALEAKGLDGAVASLLAPPGAGMPPPATDPAQLAERNRLRQAVRDEELLARVDEADFNRRMRALFEEVQYWWFGRMLAAAGSAREKLTLFWHGHFATSHTKVESVNYMLVQNETLRQLGDGPFRQLCRAMARDPAMLLWLDGRQSTAKAPNENFAREVMELFTLGEGHYSEDDIREAARAFTGWVVPPETGVAALVPRRFDDQPKRLFGQTGNFGADEAVDIICSQPRCAEFLAGKLWAFYAYPQPDAALLRSLADYYRANDLHTGKLLTMIFTHPEFYSPRARGRQVKSPVQWAVQASRELHRQLLPQKLALPLCAELGQNILRPPSVKGWDGGTAWINSATLIRRSNTARLFAVAAPPVPVETVASMDAEAWQAVAPEDTRASAETLGRRLGDVFLAAPLSAGSRGRLDALLATKAFPCDDETVREAAIVLLGSPEYNLC
jgi:uncharacterized protein (DUF1800 family)